MDSLTSILSRSRTIKTTYEYTRKKVSETYRKVRTVDSTERYEALSTPTPDEADWESDDSGIGIQIELLDHPDADNPVLTANDVTDCWARFVADPFLVYEDGLYHLFFEIQSIGRNVFIGHAFSNDGINYNYNQIVIQPETAQHSYPHVFKHDGRWLMTPSPGANVNGQFRIYEAVDFPTEWELVATPIKQSVRLDPTPIHDGETWYLIYQSRDGYDLVLKYADTLTGQWRTHPSSPLFEPDVDEIESGHFGKAEMVPSGRPLYIDGNVHLFYRSHLDRTVSYYQVTELSRDTFRQEPCTDISVFKEQQRESWNRGFMHTVNPIYPWKGTNNLVAVDGMEEDEYKWSIGIFTNNSKNTYGVRYQR